MAKEAKLELVEKRKSSLHPAAQSWNRVVALMEEARLAWKEHTETFRKTKAEVSKASLAEQKELRGIIHTQRFEFFLDHMVKYSNTSFNPLLLKEAQDD